MQRGSQERPCGKLKIAAPLLTNTMTVPKPPQMMYLHGHVALVAEPRKILSPLLHRVVSTHEPLARSTDLTFLPANRFDFGSPPLCRTKYGEYG